MPDKQNIRLTVELNKVYFKSEPKIEDGPFWAAVNFKYTHTGDCTLFLPLQRNNGYITVVGNYYEIPSYGEKLDIIVARAEEDHPKYGPQYTLKRVNSAIDFTDTASVKAFLMSIITPKQYKALLETGINIGEALEKGDVESLCQAKGIQAITANRILERFQSRKDRAVIIEALDGIEVPPSVLDKLERLVRNDRAIINIIINHPYRLIDMIDGVGFKTADKIALSRGKGKDDPERIEAFIKYELFKLGEEGQSYINAAELTNLIFTELGTRKEIFKEYYDETGTVIDNNINRAFEALQKQKSVIVEEASSKSERRVYLAYYHDLEAKISNELKRLMACETKASYLTDDKWLDKVKEQEEKQGWEYTEEQKEGIKTALENNVILITGNAGSGKSSVVSGILACLEEQRVAQCALAGKAAARLQEATGRPASTIHRLLKFQGGAFERNENNPIPSDLIIVDEISMINGEIFYALIRAIKPGAKLIMLGDTAQLESIGSLNIISDLFKAKSIPKVTLTQIHRQSQNSGILTNSLKVRDKKQIYEAGFTGIQTLGKNKDLELHIARTNEKLLEDIVETFKKEYSSALVGEDINKIQIITPMKKRGPVSAVRVNNKIQALYNPPREDEEEIKVYEYSEVNENHEEIKIYTHFRPRDKIMCIKNFYNVDTVEAGVDDIFNGWVGTFKGLCSTFVCTDKEGVKKIRVTAENLEKNEIYIMENYPKIAGPYMAGIFSFPFVECDILIPKEEIANYFSLGYASTVHKMQGSEYPCVIGAIDSYLPPFMGTKELLYTLITRAQKKLVLIGHSNTIKRTIGTSFISNKKTFLAEFLDKEGKTDIIKEEKVF